MASVMTLYHYTTTKLGQYWGYLSLIVFWPAFEFLHFHWEVSWPFMNLGNWLGQITVIIQWYEYTGVLGGTLWILLVNILLFESSSFFYRKKNCPAAVLIIASILLIISPIIFSYKILNKQTKTKEQISALIIQPNINPYTEKYNSSLFEQQIKEQIETAKENVNEKIQLIIYPEASFPMFLHKDSLFVNKDIIELQKITQNNKDLNIIAGLYTYELQNNDSLYYNTAVCLNQEGFYATHNKSKLVPAVEKTPFADYFRFLKNRNVDFGGITSSLATSSGQTIFRTKQANIATLICYESVFGEYVSSFVKNSAEILTVTTNDAWWGNTPAYKQILMHSQLRAIETRRSVVRSANTGISCLIDKYGVIQNALPINKKAVLSVLAEKNHKLTFYVKYGDYLGRLSVYVSAVVLLVLGLGRLTQKRRK
jgi:apolipoprotein N-acyltransferase